MLVLTAIQRALLYVCCCITCHFVYLFSLLMFNSLLNLQNVPFVSVLHHDTVSKTNKCENVTGAGYFFSI